MPSCPTSRASARPCCSPPPRPRASRTWRGCRSRWVGGPPPARVHGQAGGGTCSALHTLRTPARLLHPQASPATSSSCALVCAPWDVLHGAASTDWPHPTVPSSIPSSPQDPEYVSVHAEAAAPTPVKLQQARAVPGLRRARCHVGAASAAYSHCRGTSRPWGCVRDGLRPALQAAFSPSLPAPSAGLHGVRAAAEAGHPLVLHQDAPQGGAGGRTGASRGDALSRGMLMQPCCLPPPATLLCSRMGVRPGMPNVTHAPPPPRRPRPSCLCPPASKSSSCSRPCASCAPVCRCARCTAR